MAERKFRWRIDGGAWTEDSQELPFNLATVVSGNQVEVEAIGPTYAANPIATITAVITPVMPRVYAGQTMTQIANWSDFTSVENYDSSIGEMDRVEITYTGDAVDAATPFVQDESVGFTARAVNEFEQGESFVTIQQVVEYREIVTIEGALIDIDVNDIVPDPIVLDPITVEESGTPYDATYTGLTAGNARNTPFNMGALNDAGKPSFEIVDGVATGDPGLWIWDENNAEELTYTHAWRSDGVIIPGETAQTINVAPYDGTILTYYPLADDGVTQVRAESLGTAISGYSVTYAPTVTKVGSDPVNLYTSQAIHNNPYTDSIDCGEAKAGKKLVILFLYATRFGRGPANYPLDVTMNGTDTPTELLSVSDGTRFRVAYACEYDVSAGGIHEMSVVPTNADPDPETNPEGWSGFQKQAYLVEDHTVIQALPSSGTVATQGNAPTDLSAAVKNGAKIIGGFRGLKTDVGTDAELTGLTQDGPFWWTGTNQDQGCYFFEATSDAEETRTMSFDGITNATSWSGVISLLEIY